MVIRICTGKTGRIDTRLTVQRLDLQTRIIGERNLTRELGNGFCFFKGIFKKRMPVLDDLWSIFIRIQGFQSDIKPFKDRPDLSQLSLVSGRKNNFNQMCPPRVCF